jgi:hypothetical protein
MHQQQNWFAKMVLSPEGKPYFTLSAVVLP